MKVEKIEKERIDIDFILERDRLISLLINDNRYYTYEESMKIRKYVKILLKYLERGTND